MGARQGLVSDLVAALGFGARAFGDLWFRAPRPYLGIRNPTVLRALPSN